jgi:hypothetical protein
VFERFYSAHPWATERHGVEWAHKLIDGTLTAADVEIPTGYGCCFDWQRAMIGELIDRARMAVAGEVRPTKPPTVTP